MHSLRLSSWRTAAVLFAALAAVAGCTTGHGSPGGSGITGNPRTDGRPNIVFVLTDDLATNLVRYMPHVQALMETGATFQNYFVVDSLCCPSRSAIFTGLYPHNDGVFTNSGADGGYDAYNKFGNPPKSFAVALKSAGYRTGYMGKYLNGYHPGQPPAQGWDEWDVTDAGYAEYNYRLNENNSVHKYGNQPQDYLTTVLGGKAHDFIGSATSDGKPFALEIGTFAPHAPYTPAPLDSRTFPTLPAPRGPAFGHQPANAPSWLADKRPLGAAQINVINDKFRRRVEDVQSVDRLIGQLERQLAALGQLSNTYFVFSSDNGFHMGEYGLMPGKQTAFDTDIRVPLVIAGPGVPAGERIKAMASSIDLLPTFVQIAGTRPTHTPDGVSLLDLLRGQPAPADWQRAVLIEHHGPVVIPDDPDLQVPAAGKPPSYEAMRTPTELYVEYVTGEREYYDLTRDPYELSNKVGSLSGRRLTQLHDQLEALAHCVGSAACQRAAAPSKV